MCASAAAPDASRTRTADSAAAAGSSDSKLYADPIGEIGRNTLATAADSPKDAALRRYPNSYVMGASGSANPTTFKRNVETNSWPVVGAVDRMPSVGAELTTTSIVAEDEAPPPDLGDTAAVKM